MILCPFKPHKLCYKAVILNLCFGLELWIGGQIYFLAETKFSAPAIWANLGLIWEVLFSKAAESRKSNITRQIYKQKVFVYLLKSLT